MGFQLVPKSVTLNNLKRRIRRYFCVIIPNSVALRTNYVKVVEDGPILCATSFWLCMTYDNIHRGYRERVH